MNHRSLTKSVVLWWFWAARHNKVHTLGNITMSFANTISFSMEPHAACSSVLHGDALRRRMRAALSGDTDAQTIMGTHCFVRGHARHLLGDTSSTPAITRGGRGAT